MVLATEERTERNLFLSRSVVDLVVVGAQNQIIWFEEIQKKVQYPAEGIAWFLSEC